MGAAQVTAGQRVTAALLNSLPVTAATLTTGSVTNSTAETVIGTFQIPSSYLNAQNAAVNLTVIGQAASNSATATIRIRVRLNGLSGLIISDPGAITTGGATFTARLWGVQMSLYTISQGVSGSIAAYGTFAHSFGAGALAGGTSGVAGIGSTGGSPVDTTQAVTVVVTALCSAASASIGCQTNTGSVEPQG